jgi:O-antigen ligase
MDTQANLLPPPLMTGTQEIPASARRLPHLFLLGLFILLPGIELVGAVAGGEPDLLFSSMWAVLLIVALWGESYGRTISGLLAIDVLLLACTVSGFPGMYMQLGTAGIFATLAFGLFLVIRNICTFIIAPRSRVFLQMDYFKLTVGYMFAGSIMVLLASVAFLATRGALALSGERFLFEDWLHPNKLGIYAGLAILLSILAKDIPLWVRIPSGLLGTYMLLLAQSRSVILTVTIVVIAIWILSLKKKSGQALITSIAALLLTTPLLLISLPTLVEFGPIKRMIERTDRVDPTAGRVDLAQITLEEWSRSPFFGFGYRNGIPNDNAILSYGTETGIIGLALYAGFILAILIAATKTYYTTKDETTEKLARLTIVLALAIVVRGLGERSHAFQLSDLVSNAFVFSAGLLFASLYARKKVQAPSADTKPEPSDLTTPVLQPTR